MIWLILSLFFWALAAFFNSGMDTMVHHYSRSIFENLKKQQFWNPDLSWVNKYNQDLKYWNIYFPINGKNIKIKKPETFSDGWHTFKFYMLLSIIISFCFAYKFKFDFEFDNIFLELLLKYGIIILLYGTLWIQPFNIGYNFLWIRREYWKYWDR